MKVLIVDDNTADRNLLRLILEHRGFDAIREAGNGEEGFEIAQADRPDLIISDALTGR